MSDHPTAADARRLLSDGSLSDPMACSLARAVIALEGERDAALADAAYQHGMLDAMRVEIRRIANDAQSAWGDGDAADSSWLRSHLRALYALADA